MQHVDHGCMRPDLAALDSIGPVLVTIDALPAAVNERAVAPGPVRLHDLRGALAGFFLLDADDCDTVTGIASAAGDRCACC